MFIKPVKVVINSFTPSKTVVFGAVKLVNLFASDFIASHSSVSLPSFVFDEAFGSRELTYFTAASVYSLSMSFCIFFTSVFVSSFDCIVLLVVISNESAS